MTYEDRLKEQTERARMLRDFMGQKGLVLVKVEYPGEPEHTRVSIIGNAIGWGTVDVWRSRGAIVTRVLDLDAEKEMAT